jgi:hypothetical protein
MRGVHLMARLLFILLRIALIVALIYYFIKLIGRWLSGDVRSSDRVRGSGARQENKQYDELTDQTIEDAEFEDIDEDDTT